MRAAASIAGLALLVAITAPEASASHSAASLHRYWDSDNNGYPNSYQTFYAYGSHWPDLAITRLQSAANEWSNRTQGNPKVVKMDVFGKYD